MKELIIGDIAQETNNTRRVLERVRDEHFPWKPHAGSVSVGGVATHLTNLLSWQIAIVQHHEFDLEASPPRRDVFPNRSALLDEFDRSAGELQGALKNVTLAELSDEWLLRRREEILFRRPRAVALRIYGVSHMIHHRAQLAGYLRLLDLPVPELYGPAAGRFHRGRENGHGILAPTG